MLYYKIPIAGGFSYPAGCILVCAYTYGGYECCKFERVTEVGSGWVPITESEFNVRCPEFPAPDIPVTLESTEYPGCFYRMVDGEKEWTNPPMLYGEEYRTTKRHHGKVVYTKKTVLNSLYTGSFSLGLGEVEIVYFQGNAILIDQQTVDPFPLIDTYSNLIAIAYTRYYPPGGDTGPGGTFLCIKAFSPCSGYEGIFTIEYTK